MKIKLTTNFAGQDVNIEIEYNVSEIKEEMELVLGMPKFLKDLYHNIDTMGLTKENIIEKLTELKYGAVEIMDVLDMFNVFDKEKTAEPVKSQSQELHEEKVEKYVGTTQPKSNGESCCSNPEKRASIKHVGVPVMASEENNQSGFAPKDYNKISRILGTTTALTANALVEKVKEQKKTFGNR